MFKKFLVMVLSLGCVVNVYANVILRCPNTTEFVHGGVGQPWMFVDSILNNTWTIISSEADNSKLIKMSDDGALQVLVKVQETQIPDMCFIRARRGLDLPNECHPFQQILALTCTYFLSDNNYVKVVLSKESISAVPVIDFPREIIEGKYTGNLQCVTTASALDRCNFGEYRK